MKQGHYQTISKGCCTLRSFESRWGLAHTYPMLLLSVLSYAGSGPVKTEFWSLLQLLPGPWSFSFSFDGELSGCFGCSRWLVWMQRPLAGSQFLASLMHSAPLNPHLLSRVSKTCGPAKGWQYVHSSSYWWILRTPTRLMWFLRPNNRGHICHTWEYANYS